MKRGEGRALLVSLSVLAALTAYVALRFSVTTDVTALMPGGGDQEQAELARQIADSDLSRTMVLTVGAPDEDTAARASRALEAALRAQPAVEPALAALDAGPPQGAEQAMYELYHPRRLGFLAETPERARAALGPEALRDAARALKERLAQPMSTLLARLAPSDPLLILTGLFERLEVAHGKTLRVHDGCFLTKDGRFAVLFLTTRARAFDSQVQAPLLAGIERAFQQVNAKFGGSLVLDQSGVNRFAVRAEQAIEGDIERVSTLSAVGLALLMLALFRSLRLVALAAVPLGAGFVVGVASCLALYGRVHGITLAFGASLLGVALDYVEHLYCHHAVAPHPEGPRGTLRTLAPALVTGAITTLVGFLALAFAGLPGLQEVAVFASAGVLAALVTTFSMLPAFLPAQTRDVALRTRTVAALERVLGWLTAHRRSLWLLPAAALLLMALGLPQVRMGHDFMSAGQLDASLLAEDERVRERVSRFDQMRIIAAIADTDDAALRINDRVHTALRAAVAGGELSGYRSVADLLPSPAQQRAVSEAAREALGPGKALVQAFEAEGFRGEALRPFLDSLGAPAPAPLDYATLANSPLGPLVRPFRTALDRRVAYLSFLHDVRDPEALAVRLDALEGVIFLDQSSTLRKAYATYQTRTVQWLGIGLLAVLALLGVRYRDLRTTLATFLPALLACGVTLAVLALLGFAIDIVVLTALLMVLSMGVDYGVFLADAATPSADHRAIALLSVALAATSTVLGFGLLAISEHPLLAAIGVTSAVGMVASLLLAPTVLVLLRGDTGPTAPHGAPS